MKPLAAIAALCVTGLLAAYWDPQAGLLRVLALLLAGGAAAFLLLANQFRDLDLKGEEGVEVVLRRSFSAQGKPIGQLETNAEQLGFFDRLSETSQRQLLEGAIESSPESRKEFQAMLASWAQGDVGAIARSFLSSALALVRASLLRRVLRILAASSLSSSPPSSPSPSSRWIAFNCSLR